MRRNLYRFLYVKSLNAKTEKNYTNFYQFQIFAIKAVEKQRK